MNEKFSYNKFGIKVLYESSNSYKTFCDESTVLELLLLYIIMSEQNNIIDKKNKLKDLLLNNNPNKVDIILNRFLETEKSDIIFTKDFYENYFGQMAYSRIIDNSLCYFKDILAEVVTKKPEILKSSEKKTIEFILSYNDMQSLIYALSEKKINELFYSGVEDIKKYFSSRLGIQIFKNLDEEKSFNKLIKQRNLIVHNRGIISKEFSKEFSTNDIEFEVGKTIFFSYASLSEINGKITNFISDLELILCEKFKLDKVNLF